ncbi:BUD13 homolog isoform X2 [Ictalurus punctatus]|uniref:BUD13 homolog n=1 Tax=Ictalurus punctatus TaxID=7998 RepID=A0A2D0T265_ICTPU|nr:BUD13 homolog isoform X2 [Ictalurus punctatus]
MAASKSVTSASTSISKAEYLKRYLSNDEDGKKSKEKKAKKKRPKLAGRGMKIVDDDIDWRELAVNREKENKDEDDEEEAPVIAEIIDERPDEVKQLEVFRTSNKWKVLGATNDESQEDPQSGTSSDGKGSRKTRHDSPGASPERRGRHDSPDLTPKRTTRHDSPDLSPKRTTRHDSPDLSPKRTTRHDSPDLSPKRTTRHDSPDLSPKRTTRHDSPDLSPKRTTRHDSPDLSPKRTTRHDSPDLSPKRTTRHDSPHLSPQRMTRHNSPKLSPKRKSRFDSPYLSPPRHRTDTKHRRHDSASPSPPRKTQKHHHKASPQREKSKSSSARHVPDLDLSPPRRRPNTRRDSDSDLSPPRKRVQGGKGSDSDLSPPRKRPQKKHGSDSDLSPPRRARAPDVQTGPQMLSGGAAGLVSSETLRKEQEEMRRREKHNRPLEEESRHAQTIFRDKTGKKRDLESERAEQSRKAGEKAEKDEKYAQWGKGLVQSQMQQQNVVDALREAQKPLARHIDDEDLDKMLREQERDGDPMAALLRKKKEKNAKTKGIKERPRYQGPPPPPNRFNIMPGYRWDGVDRSNGFEQKRFTRIADKKAVQEEAYKWSVEDM